MTRDLHGALRETWTISAVRTLVGRDGGDLRSVSAHPPHATGDSATRPPRARPCLPCEGQDASASRRHRFVSATVTGGGLSDQPVPMSLPAARRAPGLDGPALEDPEHLEPEVAANA